MRKPPPGPFAEVHAENDARLPVTLLRSAKASNGQEFLSGQVAGFTERSAVSLVTHGAALAFVTEQNVDQWGRAFARAGVKPPEIECCTGPFVDHVRLRMAALEAEERMAREDADAAEKAKLEAELNAQAMIDAAREREAATQVPVQTSATVSSADLAAEDAHDPAPAPTPPQPITITKRGSKTPRG